MCSGPVAFDGLSVGCIRSFTNNGRVRSLGVHPVSACRNGRWNPSPAATLRLVIVFELFARESSSSPSSLSLADWKTVGLARLLRNFYAPAVMAFNWKTSTSRMPVDDGASDRGARERRAADIFAGGITCGRKSHGRRPWNARKFEWENGRSWKCVEDFLPPWRPLHPFSAWEEGKSWVFDKHHLSPI